MVTVILYGHLATQFGKKHMLNIATPAEAVRAMSANYKAFKAAVVQDGQLAYRVLVGKEDRADDEGLHLPVGQLKTVKIIPLISGAGGFGKVLLGAALIGASFFLPGTPLLAGFSFSAASIATSVGFSLLLGGVSQMLFAPPKPKSLSNERPENKPSYAFNGAVNTVAQGNPVPYFYGGPLRVGSQVISAGLVAERL
jgi:predicted phage tail protein